MHNDVEVMPIIKKEQFGKYLCFENLVTSVKIFPGNITKRCSEAKFNFIGNYNARLYKLIEQQKELFEFTQALSPY